MELRVKDRRAVLTGPSGTDAREVDPHTLAIDPELAESLHEWASVASTMHRTEPISKHGGGGERSGVERGDAPAAGQEAGATEVESVVSQRGRQLAGRVATSMGRPVRYRDPVTGTASLVAPQPAAMASPARRWFGSSSSAEESTPWGTGLVVAAFVAAVVLVALLALATALTAEAAGWVALGATVVVSGGLLPSLWLARRVPVIRWVALGAVAGMVLSWVGVLFVVFG